MPRRDSERNLTANCIAIVHQVLKSLIISTERMPYTIRAMMRILVERAEQCTSQENKGEKDKETRHRGRVRLERNQIYMLADILMGCWLNTGFRNPNCFGVLQPTDREKGFSHTLFQSCRVIFEHLFSLQMLPPNEHHDFDVDWINRYINEHKDFVYIFYVRIIEVDLPKPKSVSASDRGKGKFPHTRQQGTSASDAELVESIGYKVNSSLIRFSDLKILAEVLNSHKQVYQFSKSLDQVYQKVLEQSGKNGEPSTDERVQSDKFINE